MIFLGIALAISVAAALTLRVLLLHEIARRRGVEAEMTALYGRTWGSIRMKAIKALPDEWDRRHPDPATCSDELRKLTDFEPATPGYHRERDRPPPGYDRSQGIIVETGNAGGPNPFQPPTAPPPP